MFGEHDVPGKDVLQKYTWENRARSQEQCYRLQEDTVMRVNTFECIGSTLADD